MTQSVVLVNPIYAPTQAELESTYQVHKLWEASDKSKLLAEVAGDVRAIATDGGSGASAGLLKQLPKVEVVTVFGVGVDAVDLDYCKSKGIRVGNTPDVLSDDVADLALALCLASYRQIANGHNYARDGLWETDGPMHLTAKFSGSRVGIFGLGRIGLAALRKLPNVILQPHVASGTVQTRTAMGKLMLENLSKYLKGEELTAFVA